jgi:hypothetical protein
MAQRKLKVLVVGMDERCDDRRAWSGTVYHAIKGFECADYDVDYLWTLRNCHPPSSLKIDIHTM